MLGAGCARPAASVTPAAPIEWVDDPLVGSPPAEATRLAALVEGDLRARMVRLDRLLDLFDAARFGPDDDARETLWSALGGHPTGVGAPATRDAAQRMVQEALAIEDEARRLGDEDGLAFSADVIMMLSTDLQAPASAEDVSIQTLAYRTLVDQAHPRLQDNARWRLYDYVRGCLAGAVDQTPGRRLEVAIHALYAERDSVEDWLVDSAPHARPPWPGAEALWSQLEAHRQPLAQAPRWAPIMRRRDALDDGLRDTVRTALPAVRREDWPLETLPAGTARVESMSPVMWVQADQVVVDAGHRQARAVDLDAEASVTELSRAMSNVLARDGRGTLLLVADPALPAPHLQTALEAASRGSVERLELAVREPRVAPASGEVVMALPLYVTRHAASGAGAQAWAAARVRAHLDGRGPRLAADGRWLSERPSSPAQLEQRVRALARAYPRERGVVLTLGPDVQLRQLLELLVALQGGPERPFAAVGWMPDGPPAAPEDRSGDAVVRRRQALLWTSPRVSFTQAYPLRGQDQPRLEAFAQHLRACIPELETPTVPSKVSLELRFDEGRLREASVTEPRRRRRGDDGAMVECVREQGYALRLRSHREAMTVGVTLHRPPADAASPRLESSAR